MKAQQPEYTVLGRALPTEMGSDHNRLSDVDNIINNAIDDSVFPGAVAVVVKDGNLIYHKAFGYQDYSDLLPVQPDQIFDLASITKIMATTLSVMKLYDMGSIDLSDPVSKYISEFQTPEKDQITIRQLLLHESGLPPFRIYVDKLRDRDSILNAIKREPLDHTPGSKYVYSDLGMIILAELIEKVSRLSVDEFATRYFYEPMNMSRTGFNPLSRGPYVKKHIPPTEIDTVYGRGLVHGKVHDERSYFMDGVAGHAGLFSSAIDMAKFVTLIMNLGHYGDAELLSEESVILFTSHQSDISERGLGFDRRSTNGFSTAGTLMSYNSVGHTGFTGTSFWIDLDNNLGVILLTNRTYPNRSFGRSISRIRAEVADAVVSSFN